MLKNRAIRLVFVGSQERYGQAGRSIDRRHVNKHAGHIRMRPLVGNREQSNGSRGVQFLLKLRHTLPGSLCASDRHLRLPRTVQPQSSYLHASRRKYVELRNPHRQLLYRPILQNEPPPGIPAYEFNLELPTEELITLQTTPPKSVQSNARMTL